MVSLHGSPAGVGLLMTLMALGGLSPADDLLLQDEFADQAVGARPGPWQYFTDEGNDAAIADAPGIGGRCLRLTRAGGTVWKPMVSGWAGGEADSPVRLEFDWYVEALDEASPVLVASVRGNGNISVAQVALGGPGGVAIAGEAGEWVGLDFPIRAGQWGHLTILSDPISRRAGGAFDVEVSQGEERAEYPNVAFHPNWRGDYPDELWYSPTFHVPGGTPEHPHEACVMNVKLSRSAPREYR